MKPEKKLTFAKAIRRYCLECSNQSPSEVRECPIPDCPLYQFRFGKNPNRKGIGPRLNKNDKGHFFSKKSNPAPIPARDFHANSDREGLDIIKTGSLNLVDPGEFATYPAINEVIAIERDGKIKIQKAENGLVITLTQGCVDKDRHDIISTKSSPATTEERCSA